MAVTCPKRLSIRRSEAEVAPVGLVMVVVMVMAVVEGVAVVIMLDAADAICMAGMVSMTP